MVSVDPKNASASFCPDFRSMLPRMLPFIVPSLMAVALLAGGCARKKDVVAKVGGKVIKASEFKDAMIMKYRTAEFASRRSLEDRQQVLRDLINNKLKLLDAYRLGIDDDSTVQAAANENQKQAAIQELYKVEIMDKVIPPKAVQEFYDKMGEEIRARHILFKTAPDLEGPALESVRAKAEAAHQQLMEGANFDSLARAISEDATTAQNGGDLGYFSWGRMVDEFQEAAFALKVGEISPVVKSAYGYHIIKLEDRRPSQSCKSFDEEKENILMQLRRTYQDKLTSTAEAYLEELKNSHNLKYDYANIQKILDKVSDPSVPRNNSYFSNFSEEEKLWIVATYDNDTLTVKDLEAEIAKTGTPPRWRDQNAITKLVERMLLPDFLAQRAKEKGLYESKSVVEARDKNLEDDMIKRVEALQIDNKIDLSDSALMAYYQSHAQDFMTDSTVEVQEIYVLVDEAKGKDQAYAQKLADRARRGENFTKLVQKYSERKSALGRDGKIGPLTSKQYGALGTEAFKLKIGEISDPIKMGRRGYSVIKLLDKTEAHLKPFDESKAQVERQLRMEKSENLRKQWMDDLEKRWAVTAYDDQLMAILPPPEVTAADSLKAKESPQPKELKVKSVTPIEKGGKGE